MPRENELNEALVSRELQSRIRERRSIVFAVSAGLRWFQFRSALSVVISTVRIAVMSLSYVVSVQRIR